MKIFPVLRYLEERGANVSLIFTGQHYEKDMSDVFFHELGIRSPEKKLQWTGGTTGTQLSSIAGELESVLIEEQPSVVAVQGDTNSVFFGALIASKNRIPVAHIEAGCRSFDLRMSEEVTRRMVDSCALRHYASSYISALNLISEGVPQNSILLTGSPLKQTCQYMVERNSDPNRITGDYVLITAHRGETVDDQHNLERILGILSTEDVQFVFPMHPRTRNSLKRFGLLEDLMGMENVKVLGPQGYSDFLHLLNNARAVLTDSGGVQEEAAVLFTPCLTLRENTEWYETIRSGANRLVGLNVETVRSLIKRILSDEDFRRSFTTNKTFPDIDSGKIIGEDLIRYDFKKGIDPTRMEGGYPLLHLVEDVIDNDLVHHAFKGDGQVHFITDNDDAKARFYTIRKLVK